MFSVIRSVINYLTLCRVSNLPTIWTNVLAAIVLSSTEFSWLDFFLLALSLSLSYSGGMCLNDIIDAPVDKIKKPFRPIPSGRISIRSASLFTSALFVAGLAILLVVPYQRSVYAGLILLVFIIAYDKSHKAHPVSVLFIASCRLMIFVISSIAVSGKVGSLAAMGGIIQFIYVVIISLAARYENGRATPYSFPLIPIMIACISLLDGALMSVFTSPAWLAAGIMGFAVTLIGQRYIKGD